VDPGGIDVFTADLAAFRVALASENHTLKRALTDPRFISGIGNAYSDEILHAAQLSPVTQTHKLKPYEWDRLFTRDAPHARALGRAPASRSARWLPGEGHGVSRRHGGAWALWRTVSGVRRKGPAHSLRR